MIIHMVVLAYLMVISGIDLLTVLHLQKLTEERASHYEKYTCKY
jgi:hypothetical protein